MTPYRADLRRLAASGLTDRELADLYDVSTRTILRWRKADGIPSGYEPRRSPHGHAQRYRKGCRCDVCTRANTEKIRAQTAERRARTEANGGVAPIDAHGTVSTARNWGCWCDPCREAVRVQNAADKARRRKARS